MKVYEETVSIFDKKNTEYNCQFFLNSWSRKLRSGSHPDPGFVSGVWNPDSVNPEQYNCLKVSIHNGVILKIEYHKYPTVNIYWKLRSQPISLKCPESI
jgi:hypothetical protein